MILWNDDPELIRQKICELRATSSNQGKTAWSSIS